MTTQDTQFQLRSLVKSSGELELSVARVPIPEPAPDEVLVRIEASPVNPSDLGLLFGVADMSTAKLSGDAGNPVVTASIPQQLMRAMSARVDQSMPVGNEGAGTVVKSGTSPEAQELLGKRVAILGGAMYSQYRVIKAKQCLLLPADTTAAEGASCFVNPLTSLGMVGTMRAEGHKALVHTAAASNLGQMLNRVCIGENIPLVNIVRKQEQAEILRKLGAQYICNSSSLTFMDDLTAALEATGATLAFDAIGGGKLASHILSCMETAASRSMKEYSHYGSTVHKQVYIYGRLDRGPTELSRSYGMAWGVGGFLLSQYLQRIGSQAARELRLRVVAELKTTFASHYTKVVSLSEALQIDSIAAYSQYGTGAKYLINPNK